MATKLKVDEDLSEDVLHELLQAGFDATSIVRQNWVGRKDEEFWPDLQNEGRAIVTGDKGFSKLAATPPHHGVVLLRPERESRAASVRLIRIAIQSGLMSNLDNTLLVVTDNRIRIRRMS